MINRSKTWAVLVSLSLAGAGISVQTGCSSKESGNDRWATTENTNVKIDWDKVNQAYKDADGPEDLEKRINEIYEGDEVISISVQDTDNKGQLVTGFFDHNENGKVDEPEKIFTITRQVTGEGEAQYQTAGHGAYYGYSSPFMTIASSMIMGAMVSSMFRPSYVPMYTTPYTTSPSRVSNLRSSRSSYRAANPSRFSKPSKSGRTYGGSSGGGTRSRGGSRFGVAKKPAIIIHLVG